MNGTHAPHWSLVAGAIDGAGDTHLPPGLHVRVLPAPKLGVPATPLVVTRYTLGEEQKRRLASSSGVVWIDSLGHTLVAPFKVSADNPVLGYFPVPDVVWAELNATPATITLPPVVGSRVASPSALTLKTIVSTVEFAALANCELGPAPLQSVSRAPYALAGWPLPLVRVTGTGTVNGVSWLDAGRAGELWKASFWEVWSLPVKPAPRYTPTAAARSEAKQRVAAAAVPRQPLHVAYGASAPASAPPAGGADAFKRLAQVQSGIDRWLDTLLNDLSRPTIELVDQHPLDGAIEGTMSLPLEPFLIAGSVDPDISCMALEVRPTL